MKEQQREAEKMPSCKQATRKGCESTEPVHLWMFEYVLEYVDTLEMPLFILTNIGGLAGWINVYKEIVRCSNIFPAFENIAIPAKLS